MTLLVKDANTTVQALSTVTDGNGNLVSVHAPAMTNVQGVATPVGPQNPLPVVNTAGNAASDGSGTRLVPLVIMSHQAAEGAVQKAVDEIAKLSSVRDNA